MADARDDYQRHLLQTIHSLSDLELAALLCLIAREHCLISTPPDSVDELADELRLVANKTFGLRPVIVHCHSHTTLDDFATALLIPTPHSSSSPIAGSSSNNNGQNNKDTRSISPFRPRQNDQQHQSGSYFFQSSRAASSSAGIRGVGGGGSGNIPMSSTGQSYSTAETKHHQQQQTQPQIANIIIAKHLDRAPKAVQIQALELLRTRRIFTRTSVQPAPKQFLFIALVGAVNGGQARVTKHLNDFFYISHWHDPDEDGFPNLDGEYDGDNYNYYDVEPSPPLPPAPPVLKETDIAHLSQQTAHVKCDIEVTRYQMNITAFLRMHRAVVGGGGGITPFATKHFDQLIKSLAPLHGVDYVTPSLVALATKKIYMHRIEIVQDATRERSIQWGGEIGAIEALLEGVGPEEVINDVLGMVAVPS
ncbi:hypothetical protein V8F20_000503 [Naviculisporaceae sp. PSN 640]